MGSRRAVFLDRDDTLIDTQGATADSDRPGDLWRPDLVRLMPGVLPALRKLRQAGLLLVVFTSQGGVARGGYGLAEVEAVNDRLRWMLGQADGGRGVRFDALYYCPYHPDGTAAPFNVEHDWRKPAPGMLRTACAELGIDPASSFAVGDKRRDAQAAINAGIPARQAFVIATSGETDPDLPDLPAAATRVLEMLG